MIKFLTRINELYQRIRWRYFHCGDCEGCYAPSAYACAGCDHGSMYRPVAQETIQYFKER